MHQGNEAKDLFVRTCARLCTRQDILLYILTKHPGGYEGRKTRLIGLDEMTLNTLCVELVLPDRVEEIKEINCQNS